MSPALVSVSGARNNCITRFKNLNWSAGFLMFRIPCNWPCAPLIGEEWPPCFKRRVFVDINEGRARYFVTESPFTLVGAYLANLFQTAEINIHGSFGFLMSAQTAIIFKGTFTISWSLSVPNSKTKLCVLCCTLKFSFASKR